MNGAVLKGLVSATGMLLASFNINAQPSHPLNGHTMEVLSVAYSPDGTLLASGSTDRTVRIWDAQHETLLRTLTGHSNGVRSVVFSPNGKYLASGSRDKSIRLWRVDNGNLVRTFAGPSAQIFSVAFSPDGREIAAGSDDNYVRVWDVQSGVVTEKFPHTRAFSVAFSRSGKYLASGSEDQTVKIWDLEAGNLSRTLSGHTNSVISISFSPDGKYLASGSSDDAVILWDFEHGDIIRHFDGHTDLVSSVSFSADSRYLLTAGYDDSIRLWDVQNGSLLKTMYGHMTTVLSAAFSSDGLHIASAGEDKAIVQWDIGSLVADKSDPKMPPVLTIGANTVVFHDADGNGRLDAGELATVEFALTNSGRGMARGLRVVSQLSGSSDDIMVVTPAVHVLDVNESETVTAILKAGTKVQTGKCLLKMTVTEPNGLDSEPVEVDFNTLAFQAPNIVAADGIFTVESGGKLRRNFPTTLEVLLQNTGSGTAEEITTEVKLPEYVLSLDPVYLPIARLRAGESIRFTTSFIVTTRFESQDVPLTVITHEKYGSYGSQKQFVAHLDEAAGTARLSVEGEAFRTTPIVMASLHSEVDRNIPLREPQKENRFALVIGNEDYQRYQTGLQSEQNVAFARNDAMVFKEYLTRTLGFPENHVFLLTDATRGQMGRELERLSELARITPHAELVFYYAGHGLPDEQTRQGYIIPVDVTASSLKEGIRLSDLYKRLGSCGADRVSVFLDACFSGGGRGETGLLAARTVKVKPKGDVVEGNVVVFTATSNEEVSLPLNKESHGLFTYCLLRKLKETEGKVSMAELRDYLETEIPKLSLIENSQKQTPQVMVAPSVSGAWQTWRWQQ